MHWKKNLFFIENLFRSRTSGLSILWNFNYQRKYLLVDYLELIRNYETCHYTVCHLCSSAKFSWWKIFPKILENSQFWIIKLALCGIPRAWGLTYFLKKWKIFGGIVGSFITFGGFFSHFQVAFELSVHSFDDQLTFRKSEAPAHFKN